MADKDVIIEQQKAQIQKLLQRIQQLEEEIARLKKDSSNSSQPPSSDIVKPIKMMRRFGKKRKRGGQPGHRKFSRQPFTLRQVDKVVKYQLSKKQAKGL